VLAATAATRALATAGLRAEVLLVAAVTQETLQLQEATQAQHWHSVTALRAAQAELAVQAESDVLQVL
jgi:hypothetical protein